MKSLSEAAESVEPHQECELGLEWLIKKYNVSVPRYTSYPPVPKWENELITPLQWKQKVKIAFNENNKISLYLHLPFCESLCTYCGCNTRITKNHKVEGPYILSILKEWALYLDTFETTPVIDEIHIGGGTPTFFSAENLENLVEGILTSAHISANCTMSIEAHPGNTSVEQLQSLSDMGFRRISYGIQDSNPVVQKAINRHQSFKQISKTVELSRKAGFSSVNFDLVYGLPFQTLHSLEKTLRETLTLKPDRIAFYSYAHVPWKKPSQRGYSEIDLPDAMLKYKMNRLGHRIFEEAGYVAVGMDHFALPADELAISLSKNQLHRNFMGYTEKPTSLLIGLGASAISDCGTAYMQNIKLVEDYQEAINTHIFAVEKGHRLTVAQAEIKDHIANLMCNFSTNWDAEFAKKLQESGAWNRLLDMEENDLLVLKANGLEVSTAGRYFIRNICSTIDLESNTKVSNQYSKAI